MLRFVQLNFEVYLDHFKTQKLEGLVIKKHLGGNLHVFQSDWKYGVVAINEEMFDVVAAFTQVLSTLVTVIPVGLNREEDKIYGENRREDLFECTLVLFHKINELLDCYNVSATSEEETKEWDVIKTPVNRVLESLFRDTHSQKDYQIFTPEVYKKIKSERKFSVFVEHTAPC